MIVTSRATHAETEKGLAQIVNRVINRQIELFSARAEPARHREIAGGDNVLVFLGLALSRQQVAGDLLTYELVVRLVFVEGA